MKTTRATVTKKLTAHLQGRLPLAALVDWAERAMMETDFEAHDADLLADIVGRLGLADVAEFGLRWEDAEEFLHRLGYRVQIEVQAA
jgi:hypothetical protein